MKSEQFIYWLQGFDEIRQTKNPPTKKEWKIIQDHLKLVFTKVTPDYDFKSIPADPFTGSQTNYYSFRQI